jgi:GT2 family glycosyltransferase
MPGQPFVTAVVPVYNHKEDTREFLESLRHATYPNMRVIIIDDGSTDGTEEMILQEYPEVMLVKGDGNLFWTGGANKGIETATKMGADYILWIDNDTVVDPDFLTYLVGTAESNPKSIVVPKVYYYHDREKIQQAGWEKAHGKHSFTRTGDGELDRGQYDSQRDIPCATMGALIRTSLFQKLGMLDFKNMPQYGSDEDFTLRATKRGYRIIYEPKSKVWHKEMTTSQSLELPYKSFLSNLVYLMTNPKSTSYLRMNIVFHFKHSPKYMWPHHIISYVHNLIRKSMAH